MNGSMVERHEGSKARGGQARGDERIDVWLLHKGVGADDYLVRLDAAGMPSVPFPRPVRIAAGRTDLSRRRLLERIVHAMRETGAHGEDRMIDLSGIELEFVCIDELIVLASSFDNQVRSMEGRVPGYFLPTALAREAASIGGRWLTEGVRRSETLAKPSEATAEAPAAPMIRTESGRVVLESERSKRSVAESAKEMELNTQAAFRQVLCSMAVGAVATVGLMNFSPFISNFDDANHPIVLIFVAVISGVLSMGVLSILDDSALPKFLRGFETDDEVRYTDRFRDRRTGRVGTFKGHVDANLVRWSDEPGRTEELTSAAAFMLECFEDGTSGEGVVVDREAGRTGVIEGVVRRIQVRWDGQQKDQLLAEDQLEHFAPLARMEKDLTLPR